MQEKLENAHFTFCLLSVKSRHYVKFLSRWDSHWDSHQDSHRDSHWDSHWDNHIDKVIK